MIASGTVANAAANGSVVREAEVVEDDVPDQRRAGPADE